MSHVAGSLKYRIALAVAFVSLAALLGSQPAPREQVGPLPGGAFLLNSGWRLDPVGRQVPLDTLPMSTALSPDGKYLLVLNGGYRPPSVSVIETASGTRHGQRPGGRRLARAGRLRPRATRSTWAAARRLRSSNSPSPTATSRRRAPSRRARRHSAARQDFIGDVAFSPDGRLIYAANLYRDIIAVINPQSGMVIGQYQDRTPSLPHSLPSRWQELLRDPLGRWHDGPLRYRERQHDGPTVRVGAHASDMVWRDGAPESRARAKRRPTRRASSWPRPIPTTCSRWA